MNESETSPDNPRSANFTPGFQSKHGKLRVWLIVVAVIIVAVILIYHRYLNSIAKQRGSAPVVVVATARNSDMPVYVSGLGSVTPVDNITVRTQINGQLLQVFFREGQMVKQGDLLAQIDPRPYQAQLIQFTGQLTRDQATLENDKLNLKRYKALYPQGAVSKQVYDTQVALVKQDEGTVEFDKGQLETVKVNLIYSRITSPVNGRIGLRLVDPGNFVQTTDPTGLFVLTTISPITVIFPIPEDDVPMVWAQIKTNKSLRVEAYDRWQNKLLAVGSLLTIDNEIDSSTGTVKLKAIFPNENYQLFPNQFVNAKLLVQTLHNVTVVPTTAIQHGAKGNFVYALNNDQTVTAEAIKVGVANEDITQITGILSGQQVVVEGADKLADGGKVMVFKNAPPSLATKGIDALQDPHKK